MRFDLPVSPDNRYTRSSRFPRKTLLATFVLAVALEGICGWQAPLTSKETSKAIAAALSLTPETKSIRSSEAVDAPLHPLGVQVILVEPLELKNSNNDTTRMGEVFIFDYLKNISERYIVDLFTGEVVEIAQVTGIHLPLSNFEVDYAKSVIGNHKGLERQLRQQLPEQVSEEQFRTWSAAVQSRVSIWVPDNSRHAKAKTCTQQRCALISLVTDREVSLPIEPIVNLMTGEVYLQVLQ